MLWMRNAGEDSVRTSAYFDASPRQVWRQIALFEEVPRKAPSLLRMFLAEPLRTVGDKTRRGAVVKCEYRNGNLLKRMSVVEPPSLLEFEVLEQRLGIEWCVTAVGGSYHLRPRGRGTEIVLTTRYAGHLLPRILWRPFERWFAHTLHLHILRGMGMALNGSAGMALPHTTRFSGTGL